MALYRYINHFVAPMEITPELLERYGRGQCSAKERAAIEAWLENSDEDDDTVKLVPIAKEREQRMKASFEQALANRESSKKRTGRPTVKWLVAASLALLVGLSTFWYVNNGSTVYETGTGELRTLVLDDGSKVVLNALSRLEVGRGFGSNNRNLTLEGEAYFEVKRDSLLPFTVQTDSSRTTVLVTNFNLSAYKNETASLALTEGKVSFFHQGDKSGSPIIVLPDEAIHLVNGKLEKYKMKTDFAKAWTTKKLVFQSQKFSEVLAEVERFYGVQIIVKNTSLNNRLYRGSYNYPDLTTLLESMAFVL